MHVSYVAAFTMGLALSVTSAFGAGHQITNAQIKKELIRESIASYPGRCPCPYNTDRRGYSCGRRSAYSRPGGYSPKCYPKDVSPSDVQAYRQRHSTQ